MDVFWIAQGFGLIALLLDFTSFQFNKRKFILAFIFSASIFWTAHYMLLGALSGGVAVAINGIRTAVFSQREKRKWADNPLILKLFLFIYLVLAIVLWSNWLDVLPFIGAVIYTFALWSKEPRRIRMLGLIGIVPWLIYAPLTNSIPHFLTSIGIFVSCLIGMWRFDLKK